MARFISDDEMAQLDPPKTGKFISDDEMDSLESPKKSILDHAKDFGESTMDSLPEIGGMAGGIIGSSAGIPGALGGSAIGGYAGSAVKNLYNTYAHPEKAPHEGLDYLTGPLKEGAKQASFQAMGEGIGQVVGKGLQGLGYLGKKALTTLGPSEEAITARMAGKAQPSAMSYPELAEDMGDSLKGLKGQISEHSENANSLLQEDPRLSKDSILSPIDEMLSKQGPLVGDTDKKLASTLSSLKEDLGQYGDQVSEKDLKQIIKKLDDNINWEDQSQDKINRALEGLRKNYDSSLKFGNSSYKDAMEPVSDRMKVLNAIRRQFNFKNIPGEGLKPTDTTASKIQTSLRENKAVSQDTLGKLKDFVGKDYQDMAKDYQLAKQFDNTAPNGSRRTVLGTALGGLVGHGNPVAMGVGGLAGATLDKYGGQLVGSMIDNAVKAGNTAMFKQFAPIIESAVKRGPQAVAVTASILAKNPDFRKQMGLDAP